MTRLQGLITSHSRPVGSVTPWSYSRVGERTCADRALVESEDTCREPCLTVRSRLCMRKMQRCPLIDARRDAWTGPGIAALSGYRLQSLPGRIRPTCACCPCLYRVGRGCGCWHRERPIPPMQTRSGHWLRQLEQDNQQLREALALGCRADTRSSVPRRGRR